LSDTIAANPCKKNQEKAKNEPLDHQNTMYYISMKFPVQNPCRLIFSQKHHACQIPDIRFSSFIASIIAKLDRNHIITHSLSRPPSALLAVFLLPIAGPGPGI
jgi:hypothetical protein